MSLYDFGRFFFQLVICGKTHHQASHAYQIDTASKAALTGGRNPLVQSLQHLSPSFLKMLFCGLLYIYNPHPIRLSTFLPNLWMLEGQ